MWCSVLDPLPYNIVGTCGSHGIVLPGSHLKRETEIQLQRMHVIGRLQLQHLGTPIAAYELKQASSFAALVDDDIGIVLVPVIGDQWRSPL